MGLLDTIFSSSETEDIWDHVNEPEQVETILQDSGDKPQLIYKHSNRCSVCFVSKRSLESASAEILENADMHFVNVIKNRAASDYIAKELDIRHESPQVFLLKNGEVIWHASHGSIDSKEILDLLSN